MKLCVKKKFLVLLCMIIFFGTVSISIVHSFAATQNYTVEVDGEILENYQKDEVFTIPSASINVGGQKCDVPYSLTYPDGKTTTANEVKIDQIGTYVLRYQYYLSEKNEYVQKEYVFNVNSPLFAVDGEGKVDYIDYNNAIHGVVATLYKGDTFTYNGLIDISKLNGGALFKMLAYPQKIGESDINSMEIRITDVYDETKQVIIRMKKSEEVSDGQIWGQLVAYVDAGFDGENYIGLNYNSNGKYSIDGQKYSLTKNSVKFGTTTNFSFTGGKTNASSISSVPTGFSYNLDTNCLYCNTYATTVNKQLVADLDNSELLADTFSGFTDGKVKISITPTTFNMSYCRLIFTEFGGVEIAGTDYNKLDYYGEPDISVDFGEFTEENVPLGKPKLPYPVFSASAFDLIDGEVPVDIKVYYGYMNKNKVSVSLKNGAFIPQTAGIYTIEYSAKNNCGNTAIKKVNVLVKEKDDAMDFALNGFTDETTIGEATRVINGYLAENYYGSTSLSVKVSSKNDTSVCYTVSEQNNYSFVPYYSGEYDVEFSCSDYVETITKHSTLTVKKAQKLIYDENVCFERYLLKNGYYNFPKVSAIDLSGGTPVEVATELFINDKKVDGIFMVDSDEKVMLTYKPVGIDWAEGYEIEIPVIDVGLQSKAIHSEKYFIPTVGNFNIESSKENISFETTSLVDKKAVLEFANVLQNDTFFISILPLIANPYVSVDSISLYLCDKNDLSKFVKFTMNVENDGVYLAVNDRGNTKIGTSWGLETDNFVIDYNIIGSTCNVNESVKVAVNTLYGCDEKVVFKDGMILNISVTGNVGCGIKIEKLNNQALTNSKYDQIKPHINVSDNLDKKEKSIGDIVEFKPYQAFDVLSPSTQVFINVRDPDGNTVVSEQGVKLDGNVLADVPYTVKLDSYGSYIVTITAIDLVNPVSTLTEKYIYSIEVVDKTLPVISVEKDSYKVKAGDVFQVPKYTVDKPDCNLFVLIVDPKGVYSMCKEGTFTAKQSGTYYLVFTAIDKNGNMSHYWVSVIAE